MKLSTGMTVPIHSYKHDQKLHRIWKKAVVLEQTQTMLVTANYRTRVIECDGRSWHTKEPAICYFYNDLWFNIIGMLKKDGVYFYCNLSSPYLYDGEAIKYIDYDLDIKVFPDGSYMLLDEREYKDHSKEMEYPQDIMDIIESQRQELIRRIEYREKPFCLTDIHHYFEQYKSIAKK